MSRHTVRDLWSIRGMTTKEKELAQPQETVDTPTQSNLEVGNSPVNRQEQVNLAHKKLVQKDQST